MKLSSSEANFIPSSAKKNFEQEIKKSVTFSNKTVKTRFYKAQTNLFGFYHDFIGYQVVIL